MKNRLLLILFLVAGAFPFVATGIELARENMAAALALAGIVLIWVVTMLVALRTKANPGSAETETPRQAIPPLNAASAQPDGISTGEASTKPVSAKNPSDNKRQRAQ